MSNPPTPLHDDLRLVFADGAEYTITPENWAMLRSFVDTAMAIQERIERAERELAKGDTTQTPPKPTQTPPDAANTP